MYRYLLSVYGVILYIVLFDTGDILQLGTQHLLQNHSWYVSIATCIHNPA